MAPHTQRFAGPAVAARARAGIHSRSAAVLTAAGAHPTGRMWGLESARGPTARQVPFGVAVRAEALLRMARRAKSRIRAGLFRVTKTETRPMEARHRWPIEREFPGQCSDRDAMACRAEGLAVARGAEVPSRCRAYAVLAHEVALMDDMARRARRFFRKVGVAAVAVACLPLVFVGVARKALRHRRPQRRLALVARGGVARHAMAFDGRHVAVVRKTEMVTRQYGTFARKGLSVAPVAGACVVRFGVASHAAFGARKVEWTGVFGASHVLMARKAADSAKGVGSMFERVPRLLRTNAKYTGACGKAKHEGEDEKKESSRHGPHGAALSKT